MHATAQELHDIVTQCLQKDPMARPTCSQLLKHKFFKVGAQLLLLLGLCYCCSWFQPKAHLNPRAPCLLSSKSAHVLMLPSPVVCPLLNIGRSSCSSCAGSTGQPLPQVLRTLLRVILALNKCAWLVQKAEDGPYLVKFLLNGSNGTPCATCCAPSRAT